MGGRDCTQGLHMNHNSAITAKACIQCKSQSFLLWSVYSLSINGPRKETVNLHHFLLALHFQKAWAKNTESGKSAFLLRHKGYQGHLCQVYDITASGNQFHKEAKTQAANRGLNQTCSRDLWRPLDDHTFKTDKHLKNPTEAVLVFACEDIKYMSKVCGIPSESHRLVQPPPLWQMAFWTF